MEKNRTPIKDGSTSATPAGAEPSFLSPYLGVRVIGYPRHWSWIAIVEKDGTEHHLGEFSNPFDAALAYDRKARELFGPFAKLNFPQADA